MAPGFSGLLRAALHNPNEHLTSISSEKELLDAHERALAQGLKSHLVRDAGKTEFGGIMTLTACAIGPNSSEDIDTITGSLDLY